MTTTTTTIYEANAARLATVAPLIAANLPGEWTHTVRESRNAWHVLTEASGLRVALSLADYVDCRDRVSVYGMDPETPESMDRYEFGIRWPSITLTAAKLQHPSSFAREIARRFLPAAREAGQKAQRKIDDFLAAERVRDLAAAVVSQVPGLTLTASRHRSDRDLFGHTQTRASVVHADGTRRGTTPSVEVRVSGHKAVPAVHVDLDDMSPAAARAAIEAALAVCASEREALAATTPTT